MLTTDGSLFVFRHFVFGSVLLYDDFLQQVTAVQIQNRKRQDGDRGSQKELMEERNELMLGGVGVALAPHQYVLPLRSFCTLDDIISTGGAPQQITANP